MDANRANDNLMRAQSNLAENIAPLQADLTNLAANGVQFLADNLNWIVPVVGVATGAFVAFKSALFIQQNITAFQTGLQAISRAMTLVSGPIGIAVAAIAALVAAFVWGYQNVEPFRLAIDQMVQVFTNSFGPILAQIGPMISDGITAAFTFLGEVITTYVVPFLTQFAQFLVETVFPALQQFGEWVSANIIPALQNLWTWFSENIIPILGQLAEFVTGTVVPALGDLWSWFSSNILPILSSFWSFLQANIFPVLGQLASFITGTVVPALSDLWSWFSGNIIPILQQAWDAVQTGIDAFSDFASGVSDFIGDAKSTVEDGLNAISNFFSNLKIEFPQIKLPHFSVTGEFDILRIPPSLPSVSVEWYAKGGILTRPTIFGFNGGSAMVGGEAGHEAVLPIDRLQGYIDAAFERNMPIDGLAQVIAAIRHLEANLGNIISDYAPRFPNERKFNNMVRKAVV